MRLPLNVRCRHTRLGWVRCHAGHNFWYWSRVLFNNQSRFKLYNNDGRIHVWRSNGERRHPSCVQRWHAYRGISVMVWWCIFFKCKLPLVEIHSNMTGRSSTLKLCHTLITTICSISTTSCMMGTHQTLWILRRTHCAQKPWTFWIGKAEVLLWTRLKMCETSSNANQTIPTPSFVRCRIYASIFSRHGMTSLIHRSVTWYTAVITVCMLCWLSKEISPDIGISFFNFKTLH